MGSSAAREKLRARLGGSELVIASYVGEVYLVSRRSWPRLSARSTCSFGEVDSRRRALLSNRYETLRADRSVLCARRWDYVVLDEGHVIRNAKSKLALASKALSASYVEIAVYL